MITELAPINGEMDIGLGGALGDDLAGFDGFDDLFAPNNGPDLFTFCGLGKGLGVTDSQHDNSDDIDAGLIATAPPSPGSSGTSSASWLVDWEHGGEPESLPRDSNVFRVGGVGTLPTTAMMAVPVHGKPRARKRHDEDEALESKDEAPPVLKRRSSSACIKLEEVPTKVCNGTLPLSKSTARSQSFDVPASVGWHPAPLEIRAAKVETSSIAGQGVVNPTALSAAQTVTVASTAAGGIGGAIKVKNMSALTRPRISVFMSKPRAKTNTCPAMRAPTTLIDSSCDASVVGLPPSLVSTTSLPGTYGHSLAHLDNPRNTTTALSRTSSANRIKDLRIVVRARSQAEQRVVSSTPAVVAMGARRRSSPALDDAFGGPPTLQRASSVGALTLSGRGDVFSRSPQLLPAVEGAVMRSYQLSEHVQGGGGAGGQRRNLVCKVFGSPLNRPGRPPLP